MECFETSAHKIQKPGNHPKARTQGMFKFPGCLIRDHSPY